MPEGVEGASFAFNFSRYKSREMDDLIASYRKDRREETLADIGSLMGRNMPLMPLMYGRACVAGLVDLAALTLT